MKKKVFKSSNQTYQTKLLLDSQPLQVIPELACLIGLNEAIILQQIHYWVLANSREGRNFKEGCFWTFNSISNWQKQFPFWSLDTIRRTFASLERKNLLITANFNKMKIDRTKWYRIDYATLYGLLEQDRSISGIGSGICLNPFMQNAIMESEEVH